jgi:SAM-dependent methyltransferase
MPSEPSVSDPVFWEERYRRDEAGWDIGEAAPPLANWLRGPDAPPPGQRVAVLGCGRGHEVVLFARAGHRVIGFDFAPSAIRQARERAAAAGVAAELEQADLFRLGPRWRGAFDLVVEHCCFCAIDPARRTEYVAAVSDLLAPGGRLVALFYAHNREGGPPFATSRQEIECLFGPRFLIERLEPAPDSIPRRAGQELFALLRTAR